MAGCGEPNFEGKKYDESYLIQNTDDLKKLFTFCNTITNGEIEKKAKKRKRSLPLIVILWKELL